MFQQFFISIESRLTMLFSFISLVCRGFGTALWFQRRRIQSERIKVVDEPKMKLRK